MPEDFYTAFQEAGLILSHGAAGQPGEREPAPERGVVGLVVGPVPLPAPVIVPQNG